LPGLTPKFRLLRLARWEKEARPNQEGMAMLALAEAHPNIDVMVFYLIASALLAATLYHFHRRRI
jgi:hypothetical protein